MARILEALDQSLVEVSSSGVGKLREVLGEFEKLWVPHIRIEEENFTMEKLQTVVGMKEQMNIAEKLGRHGSKNSGPVPLALPFMFYNLEGKDREAFMKPLPWFVNKVLVPIIWKEQWKPMSPFLVQEKIGLNPNRPFPLICGSPFLKDFPSLPVISHLPLSIFVCY